MSKKYKFDDYDFAATMLLLLVMAFAAFGIYRIVHEDKKARKDKKIEERVKQYEKNLSNYNEYLETQRKIQNASRICTLGRKELPAIQRFEKYMKTR